MILLESNSTGKQRIVDSVRKFFAARIARQHHRFDWGDVDPGKTGLQLASHARRGNWTAKQAQTHQTKMNRKPNIRELHRRRISVRAGSLQGAWKTTRRRSLAEQVTNSILGAQ